MSTALVLLMTPGLAFFYGGLVRGKNAAATIMQAFVMLGVAGVAWVLWGYSLAFGPDLGGFIGNLEWFGLRNVGMEPGPYSDTIPHLTFMSFQMMFAVITPALILGAFAERAKFSTYLVFTVAWMTISLRAAGPLGLGRRLDRVGVGRARLRRRHRGAHQRRRGGPGLRDLLRQAPRRGPGDRPPRRDDGRAGHRLAVVRLVRLQRRLRPGRQRVSGQRLRDDQHGGRDGRPDLDGALLALHRQGLDHRDGHRRGGRAGGDHAGRRVHRRVARHRRLRQRLAGHHHWGRRQHRRVLRRAAAPQVRPGRHAGRRGRARYLRDRGGAADRRLRGLRDRRRRRA